MFTTTQLHYIYQLVGGPFIEEPFTAQDVITLRALVKKELTTREAKAPLPTTIPPEKAELQAQIESIAVQKFANPRDASRERRAKFINARAEAAAAQRDREAFEALDDAAALKMLGL
jgi:hypothetical protein